MYRVTQKKYVPMKISIVALIKKLFISNYNHTLFSLWKTIHQSFSYLCQFLVNVWLSQDVFQMSTISLQANLYSSGKVLNHFYTLLFRDGSYFCCNASFQFFNCLWISLVYIVFEETPQIKIWGVKIWWVRGPFHIASSAYESLFKPLPQPSNSFVGCMRCGPVLLKPLWSSHNPSPASQRCPVLVQNSYVALLVDCLGSAVIIFEPKRPGDPVLAHGHPGSIFNGMKRPLKHFFWNLGTPKNIVFTKRSLESFHHFQAHCRTIHTLLLAFPCQHQLIFALFGSCMGIGADQT